jgi:drug/metabolite transporter (DMT)-like permease
MSVRAWIIFVSLCIVWGTPYFFVKVALTEVSPMMIAWGRIAMAAAILVPIAARRGSLRPAFAHLGALTAFAFAEMILPFLLISWGEQWVSSSLAGVLIATTPMMVLVIGPLFGIREALGARRLLGLLIGFGGVLLLLGIDGIAGWQGWLGVACLLAATLGYAIGPLVVQRHLTGVDELGALAGSLAVATLVLLPFALWSLPTALPGAKALGSVAMLGVLCTAIGMLLYVLLIHLAGAARATVVAYVNPAVAALLGVFVLGEKFGLGMALGMALILLGSWLATAASKPAH